MSTIINGTSNAITFPDGTIQNSAAVTLTGGGDITGNLNVSGNLGVGTTTPSTKLNVYGYSPTIYLEQNSGAAGNTQIKLNAAGASNTASVRLIDKYIWTNTSNGSLLNIGNDLTTAQMVLDTSGNFLINTTSQYAKLTVARNNSDAYNYASNSISNQANHMLFLNDGTTTGSIQRSGGSGVVYNTSSDYRLKENIAPITGALAKVALLKPCTYTWKLDGANGQGFIAHELAEVIPDAVSGEKDELNADGSIKPQGIDQSRIVATLVAAVQELSAKVDAQAQRITDLEEQVINLGVK
jgi:hypothetical protein